MTYFQLGILTSEQKKQLSDTKLDIVRENQKYLKKHPEIRAVVELVLKAVLKARPKVKVRHFLAEYFAENSDEIKKTIEECSIAKSVSILSDETDQYLGKDESYSLSGSLEYQDSTLSFLFKDRSSFYLQDAEVPVDPETMMICRKVINDVLDNVCREDIVTQMKHFAGAQSGFDDSDTQLAFPFESRMSSLSSSDSQSGSQQSESRSQSHDDEGLGQIDDRIKHRFNIK
ncbi:hypothetical protein JTB14_005937 [Gonioctena quinquepunctata]|nr:hypothetical protein JTB14_005937 [Gonioctena quinquepunctata]